MKNILVLLILIFSFVLSAKIVKVEGEYTYTYSDDETIVQAKKKCLDFAKRDALEKFATYISSESVYKNYMTEKDQVVARSLGVLIINLQFPTPTAGSQTRIRNLFIIHPQKN